MSIRAFTVRVDSVLIEEAARSFKCSPEKFVAVALGTAILDEFDGGEIHVACDGVGLLMSHPAQGEPA